MRIFIKTLLLSMFFLISSTYKLVHAAETESLRKGSFSALALEAIEKAMKGDFASENLEMPERVFKNLLDMLEEAFPDSINKNQIPSLKRGEFEDRINEIRNSENYTNRKYYQDQDEDYSMISSNFHRLNNFSIKMHKRVHDCILITLILFKYHEEQYGTKDINDLVNFWYQFLLGFVKAEERNIDQDNIQNNHTLTFSQEKLKQFIDKINANQNLVKDKYEHSIPDYFDPIEVRLLPNGTILSTGNIKEIEPNPLMVKDPKSIIKTIYLNPNYITDTYVPSKDLTLQDHGKNLTLQDHAVMVDMSSIVICRNCIKKKTIFTLGTLCCVVVAIRNIQSHDIGLAHIQGSNIDKILAPRENKVRDFFEKIDDNTLKYSIGYFLKKMSNSPRKDDIEIYIAGGQYDRYLILKIAKVITDNGYVLDQKNIYFSRPEEGQSAKIDYTFDIRDLQRFDSGISADGFFVLKDTKMFLQTPPLSVDEIQNKWRLEKTELQYLDDLITEHLADRKKLCDQFNKITMFEIVNDSNITTTIYCPRHFVLVRNGSKEISKYE